MKRLRTFEHFPTEQICPVCGTNENAQCVLLEIDGTAHDGIAEAKCVHLNCAVAKRYHPMGITYTKLKEQNESN